MTRPGLARGRRAAQRFLFAPVDPRAAGALRILLAMCLPFFFRTWEFSPPPEPPTSLGIAWLYEHVFLTPGHEAVILALCGLLALGFRPRLTGAVLAFVLLPLEFPFGRVQSRQVLWFALIAFSFVRSDAALTPFARARSDAGPLWPIRLMQLQLSLLYGLNALAKATPAYWSGDVLMGMSLALPNFRVDLSSGSLALGPLDVPVAVLAWGSIAMEAFLAVAFWVPRLRWPAAALGVGFHATLRFVLSIHMLGWATQLLYASFLLPLAARSETRGPAR